MGEIQSKPAVKNSFLYSALVAMNEGSYQKLANDVQEANQL